MAIDFSKYGKVVGSNTPIQGAKGGFSDYGTPVMPTLDHEMQSGMQKSFGLTDEIQNIASEPLKANSDINSLKQVPGEIAKTGVNFATAPLRVAKNVAYDIPSEASSLVKEQGAGQALNNFSTSLVETEGKMVQPFINAGKAILGSVSSGVKKLTGVQIDPEAEGSFQKIADTITDPQKRSELINHTSREVQRFVVEHPEQVMLILDGINKSLNSGGSKMSNVKSDTQNTMNTYDNLIQKGETEASNVYSNTASKVYQPSVAKQVLSDAVENLNRLGKQDVATKLQRMVDINNLTPDTMTNLVNKLAPGGTVDVVAGIAKPIIKIGEEGKNILSDTGSLIKRSLPESGLNETKIIDNYNRAIKPSTRGKSNSGQLKQSNQKVIQGIKSVADNKSNLEFSDLDGNIIKGQAPQSVDQFAQAIQQTKKSIYDKYDALAKEAGEKGISVDSSTVATELSEVINNKALKVANPEAIQYAQKLQERLLQTGSLDAKTSQDVVKFFNDKLKNFYKNPTADKTSEAAIDAMVANKIRSVLDDGITNATGEQYQSLKNEYGALSSIEKDVVNRGIVWGRQNASSLTNTISNVASGAELVRGLLTMNPADLAASATIKMIQKYAKYINDPDVQVSKIFSEIEKSNPSSKVGILGQGGVGKVKSSLSDNNSFTPKSQTGKILQGAKEIPNKQGGFIRIGGKTFKAVPEATKREVLQVIKYLKGTETSNNMEYMVDKLSQKYNISQDISNNQLIKTFERLLDNTKTQ